NALSTELLAQLDAALKRIGDDRTVSAIVLTGADPAFSAGVDLDEIASGADFPAEPLARLHNSPVPVVAAINGAAVTGGLEMILACDLRIASDRARFADTHAKLGLTPAWGMPVTLPRAVGQAWARQISFTGAFIDA